jgi:hypothetical protein
VAQAAEQQAITLVLDPDDELRTLRALRALHARPLGQIVCEPATAGAIELAHHLLSALGKTLGPPDGAWRRAQALLLAERIEHIVLLRAHLLTYPALRRLADTAQATATRLWLIAAGEIAGQPIRQLLEQRAHTTAPRDHVLDALAVRPTGGENLPGDHGPGFPLLPPGQQRRRRSDLARGLRGGQRASVYAAFDDAHDWMTSWLHDHSAPKPQETADVIYRLAAAASTGSESLVRAHASLAALVEEGFAVRRETLDHLRRDHWHEIRPARHRHDVTRAAAIADRCPDTAEAALIALSPLTRCRQTLRYLTVADVAPDAAGVILHGRIVAIPPQLRPALRAQRAIAVQAGTEAPLLAGLGTARPNTRTMRRCYDRHNVPASLRAHLADPTDPADYDERDEELGDDGREILARLHPTNMFNR